MRLNRRSLRFTLRPVHFPLYWQWVLIIFKPPLFTFSPFTWCLICTFLYHISHDCGSISHTKPETMDDPTSLVSLDNSCGAGWLSAHSSYYSPRSRGRRGTVEMADLTEYFRFDWIFSGAVLEVGGLYWEFHLRVRVFHQKKSQKCSYVVSNTILNRLSEDIWWFSGNDGGTVKY